VEAAGGAKARRGGPKTKEQKRQEAEARSNLSAEQRSRRDTKRQVVEEIAKGEKRLEEIKVSLADPIIYADGGRTKKLVNEQRTLQSKVDRLYERWAELED